MAHFHCQLKVGVKGADKASAASHYAYLTRTGAYAKLSSDEELVVVRSGHLPKWAEVDPSVFWMASDMYEREKGSVYRELEGALPREFSLEATIMIVEKFIDLYLKDHAYTFGIHVKNGSDGLSQPHVHLMWSDRIMDGIERDPEMMFKRVAAGRKDKNGNVKAVDPAKGGCRKAGTEMFGRLIEFRECWAKLTNDAYASAGVNARVDHRSLLDQGIDRQPEKHMGPIRMAGADGQLLHARRQSLRDRRQAEERALVEIEQCARIVKGKLLIEEQAVEAQRFTKVKTAARRRVSKPRAYDPGQVRSTLYRQQIQEKNYGKSSKWLAQYWRIDREQPWRGALLTYSNALGVVRDKGGMIVAEHGNSDEIDAMLELATLKSWKSIQFSGTEDFKLRAIVATLKDGQFEISVQLEADKALLRRARSIVAGGGKFETSTGIGEIPKPNNIP